MSSISASVPGFTLLSVQLITVTGAGTVTYPSGCRFVKLKGKAGGGSGTWTNDGAFHNPGAEGAPFEHWFIPTVATDNYSVGAGGAAPVAGANGNNGGNTTVNVNGVLAITANGGKGGMFSATAATQVSGGNCAGANLNFAGKGGGNANTSATFSYNGGGSQSGAANAANTVGAGLGDGGPGNGFNSSFTAGGNGYLYYEFWG